MEDRIIIRGASEHNLKGVDLDLPRERLIVFTGVSGSGKSSLAFDTLYQEGQRRFMESLSAYARQFLGQMEKPKVDHIEGLSPTICIDQKTINRNPRSTVGTITEIYDHLRLLFARLGVPHCPQCGRKVARQTPGQITDALYLEGEGKKGMVLAPIVQDRKGEYRKELEGLVREGWLRARIDGTVRELAEEEITLDRYVRHTIEVVIDRVTFDRESRGRVVEAVEKAITMSGGMISALIEDEHRLFATERACPTCHISIPELEPRVFSFNSPHGACPTCDGLGEVSRFHPDLLVPDPTLSLSEGALQGLTKEGRVPFSYLGLPEIAKVLPRGEADLHVPWRNLSAEVRHRVLEGDPQTDPAKKKGFAGVIPALERSYKYTKASFMERLIKRDTCQTCRGRRLSPVALAVDFHGQNIWDLATMNVEKAKAFFSTLTPDDREAMIGKEIFKEIVARLVFLEEVGLGYLSLDRSAATLSGGEAQRIRLASQVGSGLQGVLYVLDEPSIGLHPRDNRRLIDTLTHLRDQGNTVVVVEHDRETMEAADYLVDIGPGAGREGGRVVAAGAVDEVRRGDSLTGRYLRDELTIAVPELRRAGNGKVLALRGVREHNLKGVDFELPLGTLTVVTGVSGSGKSTLVVDVLHKALARTLHGAKEPPGAFDGMEGLEHIDKVIEIDQAPIGRTPRSNPATYTGLMDPIRELFAETPIARRRGFSKSRFSFNVEGGRCEHCKGSGVKVIEMQFLADVEVPCEYCAGKRFNPATLSVTYKGKTISDVLDMTVSEAVRFFDRLPRIGHILETMDRVGLGYVALGQPSTTLSGGEAQRVKLASELHRPSTGQTLYILDEPSTGLHMADVVHLIGAMQALVDAGNTVLVIEHNTDLIKVADHVIDLGPEGGGGGGHIVARGTPEQVAAVEASHTGRVLATVLAHTPFVADAPSTRGVFPGKPRSRDVVLTGAHLHNLRHVDVRFPHNKMTVITGVSGSGKTTLAFDTLFAEGQRRYVESLSTYARRFLGRMEKAPLESIEGIAPAISVDQKTAPRNPRSTVATTTEIYDYLRLLFARVGIPHSPTTGEPLVAYTAMSAAQAAAARWPGKRIEVLAPWPEDEGTRRKEDAAEVNRQVSAAALQAQGYTRVRVDDKPYRLGQPDSPLLLEGRRIEVVLDRIEASPGELSRMSEAFEQAFSLGEGIAWAREPEGARKGFSTAPGHVESGFFLQEELTPRLFSFNSHIGACVRCDGLGVAQVVDPAALVVDEVSPLLEGLATPVRRLLDGSGARQRMILEALLRARGVGAKDAWRTLGEALRLEVLGGAGDETFEVQVGRGGAQAQRWRGLAALVEEQIKDTSEDDDDNQPNPLGRVLREDVCPDCGGARLKPLPLSVRIDGINIAQLCQKTVTTAREWLGALHLDGARAAVCEPIVLELDARLRFLQDVGLEYLTLDRRSSTLSGGESQRIRLASQLGSHLVGVLYVLDEPTVGLHPRDTEKLLRTLEGLRDRGNTVVIVEHDAQTILRADHLIDMGPGAGDRGGRVVAAGTPAEISADPHSLTGQYLSGRRAVPLPPERLTGETGVWIRGARANNLKSVDAHFPRGVLTTVTGVSGSGKSSLVMEILARGLGRALMKASDVPGAHASMEIHKKIKKAAVIDQSPLGRSPKSNPATYVGAMGPIRDLFAQMPEARARGYTKGRFSFNVAGGRCAACEGRGALKVEMHFLSDVWVPCEVCRGRRFDESTLEVRFKGKSIADVLDLEVDESLELFANQQRIHRLLEPLSQVGLGYVRLGQAATTLSGGEAQRVKLATALLDSSKPCMYILDEPTTGLHFADVERLVAVLRTLVEHGHSVVVIEHNPEVMKVSDWVIDMGPEGGARGGRVVVAGPPELVANTPESHTGRALKEVLDAVHQPLLLTEAS